MQTLPDAGRAYFRALLVLGRASNLPTVWSNCIAAWLLCGGGSGMNLLLLSLGASCLYIGGMYLNDAFDVEFDRQHRPERPIPSGTVTLAEVWGFGIGWLALGSVLLVFFADASASLTFMLLLAILLYDWIHKAVAFSPVLMAACRFFLFLVAASAARAGVTGLAIWFGLSLACYIIGLSYVARAESTRGSLKYWPCYFLLVPLLLAWIVNQGPFKPKSLLLSLIVILWILRNLRFAYWTTEKNIPRTVSGLLAGIVLVDLLAVVGGTPWIGLLFLGLFVAALLFQRFVPAT